MLIVRGGLNILFDYLGDNSKADTDDLLYTNAVICIHDLANMQRLQCPLLETFREHSIDMLNKAAADSGWFCTSININRGALCDPLQQKVP